MKKILLIVLLFCLSLPVFAYTYTLTDENGNVIFDKKCTANSNYFDCYDKISGKGSKEAKYQRTVENVYINGKKQKIIKETIGNIEYIKY